LVLIRTPFLTHVGWLGDEGILLQDATRILNGDRLYLDFLEFLPPGGFMLTAGWLAVTDGSFVAARVLAIIVLAGIACPTYWACLRVSRSVAASVGAALVWIVMAQAHLNQLSHNWFTSLFCMITFVSLLACREGGFGLLSLPAWPAERRP